MHSQTRSEHAGIFVVRSRSCVLDGSRSQRSGGAADGGASPFATPRSTAGGGMGGRGKRDDALIGKTVRIQAGQWKGYLGGVSDATTTHVQVELHSRLKKVMVVRERVAVVGDKYGATEDPNRGNGVTNNMAAPTTPFIGGGATPMHGSATPMHGAATPMHGGDGMGGDEVWRPGGAIDQNPADDDGWGASTSSDNPFEGSPSSGNDGGGEWGSSNDASGSTWAPSTNDGDVKHEETPTAASSQRQDALGGAVKVKSESMEAGEDLGDADETAVWFMERVCVQIKSDESSAVIKEINSDKTATVEIDKDRSSKVVRVGDVFMIPPKEHDMVLVTGGADVGVEGELVCVDGTDAILKDASEEFKIVDFVHLAKIVGDA